MNVIKIFTNCFLLFTIAMNSQDFETNYKVAKADYENEVFESLSFDEALNSCPDISKYPELLVYKGVSLKFKSENLLAIKYIKLALSYLKDKEYIYECHSFLGFVYSSADDLDKALYHYKMALKLGQELKNDEYIYENKFNILLRDYDLIEDSNNTEDRKQHLKKMLDFYYSIPVNFKVDIRLVYMTIIVDLSEGVLLLEDYKELKTSLKNDFKINSLTKDFQGQYYNSNAILEAYLKNYTIALKYCDSSYYISKNFLYKENRLNDFYTYKEIYKQINKPKLALQYSDSILRIEESFKIQELESGINLIDENILYNTLQNKTREKISFLNILIVILAVIVLVIIFFLIYSKKARLKLQAALGFYKEKYNNLWSNYQISNQQLKKLKEELTKQPNNVNTLVKDLSLYLNNNVDDEHKHINIIKDNFINALQEKAPYLGKHEQLVCFFINLNLSHKKIAELLNKTEKSIDSYKYRINKKVKENHNTNAEELINTIKL